jgi:hypothetical protein
MNRLQIICPIVAMGIAALVAVLNFSHTQRMDMNRIRANGATNGSTASTNSQTPNF